MTDKKENVEASKGSKDTSESIIAEIDKESIGDEKEEDDDHMEEDQISEEQETDEEDKDGEDQDMVNDQISNEHLQPKHPLGTSDDTEESQADIHPIEDANHGVDKVNHGKNGDAELHKEEPKHEEIDDHHEKDKTKGSDYNAPEMQSKALVSDVAIDYHAEPNEKNEQGSHGHHDAVLRDSECSTRGVKAGENMKKVSTVVDSTGNDNDVSSAVENTYHNQTFMCETPEGGEAGTEEEQLAFMKALEAFCREKVLEFKPPKFYGEPLNLLKLWRAVIKLGGYDKVTACKLWRQVGESFNPPKTCTTVSWTFRIFYEKALLEYERHKIIGGELDIPATVLEPVSMESPAMNSPASGSGRARRDAAARAMQGWHSQRLLGNGEVSDPIIKDKSSLPLKSREKHLKNIGGQKRKKPMGEPALKASHSRLIKGPSDTAVVDVGPAADWVKVNVRTTKDCYEVYALVPGLLREEVRVQSDPAGRLVITGEPEHADNPWGVTPFKKAVCLDVYKDILPSLLKARYGEKSRFRPPHPEQVERMLVVSLPSRIDPHQTSAVVTLHGQLFVRVPFEQSDNL